MSRTYTAKYLSELKNPNKQPDTFIEINLGGSVVRWGYNKILSGSVHPALKSVSKQYNKLDIKKNIVTKGSLSFSVADSAYIQDIIQNNRLKNLRVKKYEGFIASGWDDTDYINTFEGVLYDWNRKGEIWSFKARDIRERAQAIAPVAETDKTQFLDYSDTNPIDMMTNFASLANN